MKFNTWYQTTNTIRKSYYYIFRERNKHTYEAICVSHIGFQPCYGIDDDCLLKDWTISAGSKETDNQFYNAIITLFTKGIV